MRVLAIDPGPTHSAYVIYDGEHVLEHDINGNGFPNIACDHIACEMLECQGNPVGRETFETAYFIGQLMYRAEQLKIPFHRVYRHEVKMHLCGTVRARDSNVRQALIDKFGGNRKTAIGTKPKPGPLYGITSHCWSALAVAVTWSETK